MNKVYSNVKGELIIHGRGWYRREDHEFRDSNSVCQSFVTLKFSDGREIKISRTMIHHGFVSRVNSDEKFTNSFENVQVSRTPEKVLNDV